MGAGVSQLLLKHLYQEHGSDTSKWPSALRDLIDPSIEARAIAPPISGKVDKFLNTDFYYYWAFDRCGQEPSHDRVESMRYAGWQYATTDDVKMCSLDSAKGRNKDRKSKDGGEGWSDEIRSGDRRLMKIPMTLWRSIQKANLIAAYQLSYPQPFVGSGKPGDGRPVMTNEQFVPGVKTELMSEAQIADAQSRFTAANSVAAKTHKQIEEEARAGKS